MAYTIKIVVKKNTDFINLHKNGIFNHFRDIWQNMFRAPNFEVFSFHWSLPIKKKKKRIKYFFEDYIYAKFHQNRRFTPRYVPLWEREIFHQRAFLWKCDWTEDVIIELQNSLTSDPSEVRCNYRFHPIARRIVFIGSIRGTWSERFSFPRTEVS